MRPVVLLSLLCLTALQVGAAERDCTRSCRNRQHACIRYARADLAAARPACADDPARAHTCLAGAKRTLRRATAACREFTRETCRPSCRLGGVNEWARRRAATLPAEPQEPGDPLRGRELLLAGDYMTCGVPWKAYAAAPGFVTGAYGGGTDAPRIADRPGRNADLPYFLNAFTTPDGVEVVNANCLMCHGGLADGQLVVGLGNAAADFTAGAGGSAAALPLGDELLDALGLTEPERAQLRKIAARGAVLAPRTMMRTVGMNPAELFAVILMVHHDRETLAWSDQELIPLVLHAKDGQPIPEPLLTSDPPPWWRAHKKHALFYNGMARGDHRGTMALATSVCVDDVARAREVDAMFRDMQAYVASIRAPRWPRGVDAALVARGERLFVRDCAGCHGTYAARDEDETYPNLLVPLEVVGTDPAVAEAGVVHSPELVAWYNDSFYGRITRMAPDDPFPGYMPPPLDGIWATAPYLHNGSVPTVELVLDSRARPRRWRRVDLDSRHLDEAALGWPWVAVDRPQAELPEAERKLVYDTTYWSQSNAGHTFGDHLTADERRAVVEYLKTL